MTTIQLTNDVSLTVTRLSNTQLLGVWDTFPTPKIPSFYIESQDRWIENPDHPDYHYALQLKQLSFSNAVYEHILSTCVEINGDYGKFINKRQLRTLVTKADKTRHVIDIFNKEYDVIVACVLTEQLVQKYMDSVSIMRNGQNIYDVQITNALNTNIHVAPIFVVATGLQAVHPIDEFACVKSSGLNWNNWVNNEYSLDMMATTIALYRMAQVIDLHVNDAQAIESERQSKKHK